MEFLGSNIESFLEDNGFPRSPFILSILCETDSSSSGFITNLNSEATLAVLEDITRVLKAKLAEEKTTESN